ncbi:MAG: serine hydrolase, partial [Eubacteriales bacterium]|nr:serine hydrolase [Eubacteriales bacterium]
VIHEISGERFFDYERKNIFFHLEMENIAGHPLYKYNPKLINNKAKGYISEKDGSFREKGWVYVPGYPSGAADGTVTALAKFAMALTPENPVDSPLFDTKEAFEELFKQSYSLENINTSIAHGFWEFGGKIKSYGHGGNTAGFTSYFAVSPETRTGLIVLTNSGEETDLIYELHEQIFGEIEMEKRSAMVFPSVNEVSGRYIPARAPHKNFLELFSYLSAYEVIEENEGEIKLLIPGHEAKYIQVAPY